MRWRRTSGLVLGGIAALLVLVVVTGIIVMRTGWFRDTARDRIERALADATGGQVEIGEFHFDWQRLRVEIRNLVIRGLEKPPEPPLFRARLVRIDLRLFTALRRPVDIAALLVDEPQANVIVYENGGTNIPPRAVKEPVPERTALETIVDLAAGEFALTNGSLRFGERRVPLNVHGRNLRARLDYVPSMPGYKGQVAMAPIAVASGARQPVDVSLSVPLALERDRIRFENAVVSTPGSRLTLTGAVTNLRDAVLDAHVRGHVSLAEAERAGGLNIRASGDVPSVLQADLNLHAGGERIRLSAAHLRLGASTIRAEGTLRDASQPAGLDFTGTVELGELGRLLRLPLDPAGVADVSGRAALENGQYSVRAAVDARRLAFTLASDRFTNVTLVSTVRLDPRRLELTGTHARILGGAFTGRATIDEWDRFEAAGRIAGFDVKLLAATFADLDVPWGGTLSGPVEVRGDFDAPTDLTARSNLTVSPAPDRGIPMRGRLDPSYDGSADTLRFAQSWVALPQSRVDFSGVLGQRLDVRLASRDLREVAVGFTPPVELDNGAAFFDGVVLGRLNAPQVKGRARLTGFRVQDRRFDQLIADVDLAASRVALSDGALRRGALDARFNAVLGLQRYRATQRSLITLDAVLRNADVRDVLALAGRPGMPASGTLNASARITGTLGDPRGEVAADVFNGEAWQQPFDRLALRAFLQQGLIRVPTLWIGSGPARVSGELAYNYTPGELRRGTLTGKIASSNVQLGQMRAVVARRPTLDGALDFDATFAVNVWPAAGETRFQIARMDADFAARNLQMHGDRLGDLTGTARTSNNVVTYNVASTFANSSIHVAGRTALQPDYPTDATARIDNLPLEPALAVAGRPDIDLTGMLDADARLSGTLAAPRASGSIALADAAYEGQPIGRLEATATVTERLIDVPSLLLAAGDARLTGAGRLAHPGDYRTGNLEFQFQTNRFDLAQTPAIRSWRPGLAGAVEARAEGAATLRPAAEPLVHRLNALVTASGVQMDGARLGSLHAVAETRGGDLQFNVKSDFASADIRASGAVKLTGDYPLTAELTFANLTYAGIEPFVPLDRRRGFDAVAQGRAVISGPAARPRDLAGKFEISRLEMYSVSSPPGQPVRRAVQVRNAEPLVFALQNGLIRVQTARFFGPFANFEISGSASIRDPYPLNLRATGEARLELMEAFMDDVFASGNVFLNAAVQGSARDPVIAGRLDLRNVNVGRINWPAGLSEAQGTVLFSGRNAVIQNVTGLVGGGKLTLSGAVGYGGPEWTFRLQATGREIRVQYPQNVSTAMNADLSLAGATGRSLLSGEVSILDVAFYTHTDIGSIFAGAAKPTAVPAAQVGLLSNMRLDIRVETAPDVQFRTTLAENIDADAQLQVRGTAARPGALGRLEVTAGEVEFFGTRYNIDQGSVAFYNPNRLEPIVNINLTTRARGIDVTLTVSGPMDRMQLTYRSDPPLQFSELVALLATGAVPTTDPVLVAREPTQPQQSFQQMGASTLLGQAVATPVAGRLQRLFGVTALRIDPQIVGTENVPQARFTLEQQVTPDLLFTYIQDVTESNPQIIRVEWAFDPTWSVVAQRGENGAAGVDLFWRRRFR